MASIGGGVGSPTLTDETAAESRAGSQVGGSTQGRQSANTQAQDGTGVLQGGRGSGGSKDGQGSGVGGGRFATGGVAQDNQKGAGDAPAVRFVGRMDFSDAAGPRFAWSGSGMIARFSGTSVGAKLAGGQQYTVVLDGVVESKLTSTSGTNTIATGLSPGNHIIELYRRTEASQGEAQFLGFDFGTGTLLAPPAPATRRLEVVGDSISCGYGIEGPNKDCGFTPETENHYLTYAAIAARDLGAELHTIAWSGKGVVCNYGDLADSCVDPMPTYYDRALPNVATSNWDFSRFQPDAVIINLGTNDVSTEEDPPQSEFEGAYKKLLEHIRSKNPNAYLLCTNGPMLSGGELTTVRGYIDNVVEAMNAAGDSKVGSFDIAPQLADDGYGCDYHPNPKTHQKLAETLKTELKRVLNW